MRKLTVRELTACGILAALYAVITIATASFAYGPIQFRVADALCVLPFFMPVTSIGLFVGCLVANLFSTVSALDIVIGSAATLLGCIWAGRLKHKMAGSAAHNRGQHGNGRRHAGSRLYAGRLLGRVSDHGRARWRWGNWPSWRLLGLPADLPT